MDGQPEGIYHYGIWVTGDGRTGDWMAKLKKVNGCWELEYRFRYYDEADPQNDPFSGKDRKSWYTGRMVDDSEESLKQALAGLDALLPLLALRYGHPVEFIKLECTDHDPKFLQALRKSKFFHVKEVKPGDPDYEKYAKEGGVG